MHDKEEGGRNEVVFTPPPPSLLLFSPLCNDSCPLGSFSYPEQLKESKGLEAKEEIERGEEYSVISVTGRCEDDIVCFSYIYNG